MYCKARDEFATAVMARGVLARFIEKRGMEHASPEALQEYLKEHPGADKSLHTVKKPEKEEAKGDEAEGSKAPKATKPHALDDLPGLKDNAALQKARSPKASKDDLDNARGAIQEAIEKLYDAEDADEDDPRVKKLMAADEELHERFNEAVQKSPDYASKKTTDYYPQKMPKGLELPKEVGSMGETMEKYIRSMPDNDLDKEEAYSHPKVKAVRNKLIKALKSGELTKEKFYEDFKAIEDLGYKVHENYMSAKTDKESDPHRFLSRKIYQTTRAFRDVVNNYDFDKKKSR